MGEADKGRIVYLSFGEGVHLPEIVFSICSAKRWTRAGNLPSFVIYTDQPERFQRLPAEIVAITPEQFQKWRGEDHYSDRIKIEVLGDALRRYSVPVIVVDADTYFMGDPQTLLNRVGPGESLMHTWECQLSDSPEAAYRLLPAKIREKGVTDRSGKALEIPDEFDSYNSGVVGLHPADAALTEEVAWLCDQMYRITRVRTCEQLAFGYMLSRRTRLRWAWDVVYHYQTWGLRSTFERRLDEFLARGADLPDGEWVEWMYARRPRARLRRRLHVRVQHALGRMGLMKGVVVTSESW